MGEAARTADLERRFLERLRGVEQVTMNGDRARAVPGIVNLRFHCVESESLVTALPDIALSTGSACKSARVEPSHVLLALGLGDDSAHAKHGGTHSAGA